MRNTFKFKAMLRIAGIIALAAIIGFSFAACDDGGGGCNASCLAIGATGPGSGKIIYHKHSGFKVTGAGSFTAYYLEAAPTDQATSITWSSTRVDVTGATGTAIGTGKANTAAIIAAHSGDTELNNAAKAAVAYTGGDKNDWFLPSKDELNAMYKARTHLDISSAYLWSSSQSSSNGACGQKFGYGNGDGYQGNYYKDDSSLITVRAIRAF